MIVIVTHPDGLKIGSRTYKPGKTLELSGFAGNALLGKKVRAATAAERQKFLNPKLQKIEVKVKAQKAKDDADKEPSSALTFADARELAEKALASGNGNTMRSALASMRSEPIPGDWKKAEIKAELERLAKDAE